MCAAIPSAASRARYVSFEIENSFPARTGMAEDADLFSNFATDLRRGFTPFPLMPEVWCSDTCSLD
jgi:hypothetical protein